MEIGPYRVRNGGKLESINGSWNEFANLLFVDNPVGTGYSYVETNQFVSELQQMADQFMQFLEKWFNIFPEYRMDDVGHLIGKFISQSTNGCIDLHCRRIVCWSTYTLHCKDYSREEQVITRSL
jgi:Serine carboxypeptidase